MEEADLAADLDAFLARHEDELIEFRRDLHAHPELANAEHRTTRRVALRLADEKDVPYRSTIPNACHACGHDVHTTVLLGTGLYLAERAAAGELPGRVRLIFQPAEEAAR